jgi:hypothetical protein
VSSDEEDQSLPDNMSSSNDEMYDDESDGSQG